MSDHGYGGDDRNFSDRLRDGDATHKPSTHSERNLQRRRERLGPKVEPGQSIAARFKKFHESNPEVYRGLVRLARKLKNQGVETYGIGGLYEVLRYDKTLSTSGEPFKLSNDYRSRYARLIMEQEADLRGFFRTRELTSL